MKKPLTLTLAVVVTATALAMASVAAWQRADTLIDRVLLMAIGCVIVASAHLLPALTKRRMMWPIWAGCFVVALYGHAGFFSFANTKAGEARASQSLQGKAVQAQRQTIEATLDTIKARPLAQVAAQLSRTHDSVKREALAVELEEAKRAAGLRDEIVRLGSVTASNDGTTDPVIKQLVAMTGASDRVILLALNLLMACMVELVGVVLWLELASGSELVQDHTEARDAHQSEPLEPIDQLRDAIRSGRCKGTVASIRQFLACGQEKAMQLRRDL